MTIKNKIKFNKLHNIKSVQHFLQIVYNNDIKQITLPIDPEYIIKRINKITYNNEYSFDAYDKYSFIKVQRKENNDKIKNIFIWVNSVKLNKHQKFTLAYQIGHLIYDIIPNINNKNIDEYFEDSIYKNMKPNFKTLRADKFATQLLMPDFLIKKEVLKFIKQCKKRKLL